jgi:hypothetical protein
MLLGGSALAAALPSFGRFNGTYTGPGCHIGLIYNPIKNVLLYTRYASDRSVSARWQNGYAERLIGSIRRECLDYVVALASAIFATFSHRTKHTTTRSERTYRCRSTRRFGVMCAEQGACVRRRSWAGYTDT